MKDRMTILVMMLGVAALVGWMVTDLTRETAHGATARCTPLAHRGVHSATVDENTAEAAAAAAGEHAWLDADIRMTSDGVPVLMHDRTVDRTTDGHGRIEDHDSAWVAGLNTEPNGQRVPTWSTYLGEAGTSPVAAELKQDVAPWTDDEIQTVIDAAAGSRVYLGGAPAMLKRINALSSDVGTYWRPDTDDLVTQAEASKRSVELVLGFVESWTPEKVTRFRAAGYKIGSRQTPTPQWGRYYDLGIRLISTGNAAALNNWCASR